MARIYSIPGGGNRPRRGGARAWLARWSRCCSATGSPSGQRPATLPSFPRRRTTPKMNGLFNSKPRTMPYARARHPCPPLAHMAPTPSGRRSKFEDIFDVGHFINYVKDEAHIVRDIPDWFMEKDQLFTSIKSLTMQQKKWMW